MTTLYYFSFAQKLVAYFWRAASKNLSCIISPTVHQAFISGGLFVLWLVGLFTFFPVFLLFKKKKFYTTQHPMLCDLLSFWYSLDKAVVSSYSFFNSQTNFPQRVAFDISCEINQRDSWSPKLFRPKHTRDSPSYFSYWPCIMLLWYFLGIPEWFMEEFETQILESW